MRLSQWGIVQAWLAEEGSRKIEIVATSSGLLLRAIDPLQRKLVEVPVPESTDPSRIALQAIGKMNHEADV